MYGEINEGRNGSYHLCDLVISSWLEIQRSSESGTGPTHPREYN
jgi:hypothetical protein